MDPGLPSGTVTFLFTDIEGSTQLLQQLGSETYAALLAGQRQILRAAFDQFGGREIDTQGDSFFASFPRASEAVAAVAHIQRALAAYAWPDGAQVRVRMGLHTGEPWLVEEGYVGMDVHRAARIAHAGHGGQVLLSETTAPLIRDELPEGVSLRDLGRHRLKDMRRPERIHQLVIDGLPDEFPPLKSLEDLSLEESHAAADGRPPREVGASPYRGLAAFHEEDARFFFGREAFTAQLRDALQQRQLVAVVVGSSGSGKSSTVFAGLLPRLRESGNWLVVPLRPGAQPFLALAGALVPLLEQELSETDQMIELRKLAAALQAGELALSQVVERALHKADGADRLLLVIDQFEELYTLVPTPNIREAFLDELLAAVQSGAGQRPTPFVFLLTLRADFMGQALTHRPFADALQAGALMLGPMNRDELRAAIEQPAALQGAAFEPGLVTRILDDVGQEPGNLPLLEFALTLLWDRMEGGWLTHAAYDDVGRVEGALARYADEVYNGLARAEQDQVRRAFVQLVQPGQGTEDTRRVARRADLVGVDWGLVQHLADQRLIVTGLDETGAETVEVVHEALIRGWGQLRSWMAADRAFRTWQEGLRAAQRSWAASGQDEGALLRGGPLAQAEDWLAERGDYIGETEKNYIQASVALRARRQAERERQRRLIMGGLAVGLVLAVLLSVYAFGQRGAAQESAILAQNNAATATIAQGAALDQAVTAEAERLRAEVEADARATQQASAEEAARVSLSRELAASAINSFDVDPERGILLALQALSFSHTAEAKEALHQAIQNSSLRQTIYTETDQKLGMYWLTSSPDGRQLFVSGAGGGSLWDIDSSKLIYSLSVPGNDWINHAAFSPDGSMLVLPGETYDEEGNNLPGVVTILDAKSGQEILNFTAHDAWVQGVTFSQDGAYLATISGDRNPKIWDFEATLAEGEGKLIWTLCCPDDWDNYVEFSPDGTDLMTTTGGGEAIVWDLETGTERLKLGPEVDLITYHPDGNYLVSLSDLGLVQVWDAESGERISSTVISDRSAFVDSIRFSPDGLLVAIGKRSGQIILLDFSPTQIQEYRKIPAHTDWVTGIEFSTDSKKMYSSSVDRTIHVWDLTPSGRSEFGAIANWALLNDLAMLKDGQRMVSVSRDGVLRVWDTQTWDEILNLKFTDGTLHRLAISPDGELVATGGSEGIVTVLDTNSWEEVVSFQAHPPTGGPIYFGLMDVAFSPDGQRLVTGSAEGAAAIWDSQTGDQILSLADNLGQVNRVLFSPDGRLVAAGALDTAHIWDAKTGQLLETFSPNDWQSVLHFHWAIDFSPDSSRLALGRSDNILEVWKLPEGSWESDKESAQLINRKQSEAGFINAIRFSPRGDYFILGGDSDIVEIRNTEDAELELRLQVPGGIYELVPWLEGRRWFVVGIDGSLQVITLDLDELIDLAHSRVTRSLTPEECQTYLHIDECP